LLIDPIYDLGELKYLRARAKFYVHGHSAGGTNPSLVEAMHFGIPVAAYECSFNRYTMANLGRYFRNEEELRNVIGEVYDADFVKSGAELREIAEQKYTWRIVGEQYFQLICRREV